MTYGFELRNDQNKVVANSVDYNYGLLKSGTLTLFNSVDVGPASYNPITYPNFGETKPLIFIKPVNPAAGIWFGASSIGPSSTYIEPYTTTVNSDGMRLFVYGDSSIVLHYRVYVPFRYLNFSGADGTYGLSIFDQDGYRTFDSRKEIPRINQIVTGGQNVSWSTTSLGTVSTGNLSGITDANGYWCLNTIAQGDIGNRYIAPNDYKVVLVGRLITVGGNTTFQFSYGHAARNFFDSSPIPGDNIWNNNNVQIPLMIPPATVYPLSASIYRSGDFITSCTYGTGVKSTCMCIQELQVDVNGGGASPITYSWEILNDTQGNFGFITSVFYPTTFSQTASTAAVAIASQKAAGTYTCIARCTVTQGATTAVATYNVSHTHAAVTPSYTLTSDVNSVNEGGTVTFTLTSTNVGSYGPYIWGAYRNSDANVSIPYTITGVTGTITAAELNESALTGNIVFNQINTGNMRWYGTKSITPTQDVTTEGTEVFRLAINNTSPVVSKDITINDTSVGASWTVSTNATIAEGANGPITVSSGIANQTFTVNIVQPTGAFVTLANSGQITTNASGSYTAANFIYVGDDIAEEGAQTVTVQILNTSSTVVATTTFTIPASDVPVWSASTATSIAEGSTSSLTVSSVVPNLNFYVVLDQPSGANVSLSIAGSGPHSTGATGSVTLSDFLVVGEDTVQEADQTVTVQIKTALASSTNLATTTFTIPANDAPVWSASATSSIAEGSTGNLTVNSITNGIGSANQQFFVTVDALSGSNVTLTGGGPYNTGSTGSITLSNFITVGDDTTAENAQTVTLRIKTGSTSGTVVASPTFTIPASDQPIVYTISLSNPAIYEGQSFSVTVGATTGGSPVPNGTTVIVNAEGTTETGVGGTNAPYTFTMTNGSETRLLLTAADSLREGLETITLKTPNTAVSVIGKLTDVLNLSNGGAGFQNSNWAPENSSGTAGTIYLEFAANGKYYIYGANNDPPVSIMHLQDSWWNTSVYTSNFEKTPGLTVTTTNFADGITVEKTALETGEAAGGAWGYSQLRSTNTFTGGAYVCFEAGNIAHDVMIGLDDNPAEDAGFGSLAYSIYLAGVPTPGKWTTYENGYPRGWPNTQFKDYILGDRFEIVYSGTTVQYYKNGTLEWTTTAAAGQTLGFDSTFKSHSPTNPANRAKIKNLQFRRPKYIRFTAGAPLDDGSTIGGTVSSSPSTGWTLLTDSSPASGKTVFIQASRGSGNGLYISRTVPYTVEISSNTNGTDIDVRSVITLQQFSAIDGGIN